jgi:hypothetical protein
LQEHLLGGVPVAEWIVEENALSRAASESPRLPH